MAYKIPSKTFKVSLTSPDGDAIFEFKLPLWTRILDSFDTTVAATAGKIKSDWEAIVGDIVSIEGFEGFSTKEEILAGLDFTTMRHLITAYNGALAQISFVDQEKKDSTSE